MSLSAAEKRDLQWFFCDSAGDISGVKSPRYGIVSQQMAPISSLAFEPTRGQRKAIEKRERFAKRLAEAGADSVDVLSVLFGASSYTQEGSPNFAPPEVRAADKELYPLFVHTPIVAVLSVDWDKPRRSVVNALFASMSPEFKRLQAKVYSEAQRMSRRAIRAYIKVLEKHNERRNTDEGSEASTVRKVRRRERGVG